MQGIIGDRRMTRWPYQTGAERSEKVGGSVDRYHWAYQLISWGNGGLAVPDQIHQVLVPRLAAILEPSEVAECGPMRRTVLAIIQQKPTSHCEIGLL